MRSYAFTVPDTEFDSAGIPLDDKMDQRLVQVDQSPVRVDRSMVLMDGRLVQVDQRLVLMDWRLVLMDQRLVWVNESPAINHRATKQRRMNPAQPV